MNALIIAGCTDENTNDEVAEKISALMKEYNENGDTVFVLTNDAGGRHGPRELELPKKLVDTFRDLLKRALISQGVLKDVVMNDCGADKIDETGAIDWDKLSTDEMVSLEISVYSEDPKILYGEMGTDYNDSNTLTYLGDSLDNVDETIEIVSPDMEEALGLFGFSLLYNTAACVKINTSCGYTKEGVLEYMDAAIMD